MATPRRKTGWSWRLRRHGVRPSRRLPFLSFQTISPPIYASGWFSDVRIQPGWDGPLGVQLVVIATANPCSKRLEFSTKLTSKLPRGSRRHLRRRLDRTLKPNTPAGRVRSCRPGTRTRAISLARNHWTSRVSPRGWLELTVREGHVQGWRFAISQQEGSAPNDEGANRFRWQNQALGGHQGDSRRRPGRSSNRRNLEGRHQSAFTAPACSAMSRWTSAAVPATPGEVVDCAGDVEQSTGSLLRGFGLQPEARGLFGQIQLQDTNRSAAAWDMSVKLPTLRAVLRLADISFTDP